VESEKIMKLEKLKSASPLEVSNILIEFELYDKKSSQEIIDEVYEQFRTGEQMEVSIITPVFSAIVDGLLERTSFGKGARKKGLTTERVVQECKSFSYDEELVKPIDRNAYEEYKNVQDSNKYTDENNRDKFNRSDYENKYKMDEYKANKLNNEDGNSTGRKLIEDEYTGKKNIYVYRNDPDKRRNDPKFDYQAETDHIVPLKQVYTQLKDNYALSNEDIKVTANADYNLAVTSGAINGKKLDDTNSEFIKKQGNNLDAETTSRMIDLEKNAQKAINAEANKRVLNNLTGQGELSNKEIISGYDKFTIENGREPTKEEKGKIKLGLQKSKTDKLNSQLAENTKNQTTEYAVGNVILYIIKPLYYEVKDIFKNGMMAGTEATSPGQAFLFRCSRIKNHLLKHAGEFLGDSIGQFIKNFIKSLFESIVDIFVGVFKQFLRIIKEGIKVFIQSAKILFGKDSKKMTAAQKGDAIIKLLGGSLIALAGIGIELYLNKLGIKEPWSVVISTIISGLASALFMYFMDKVDLFSAKAEKRKERIEEIFNERIAEIQNATETFNVAAIETLKNQREQFEIISNDINKALGNNDIDSVNSSLYKLAKFYQVDLPYESTEEFVKYFDESKIITI